MSTPVGWFVSPADDRIMRESKALADEKVLQYHAYIAQHPEFAARQALRDRMGMIITIDRAGTERSIVNQY
jgi:hypothetical protein